MLPQEVGIDSFARRSYVGGIPKYGSSLGLPAENFSNLQIVVTKAKEEVLCQRVTLGKDNPNDARIRVVCFLVGVFDGELAPPGHAREQDLLGDLPDRVLSPARK